MMAMDSKHATVVKLNLASLYGLSLMDISELPLIILTS